MPDRSAGILLFRRTGGRLEVLLAHPGGPYWAARDEGIWTIPKGMYDPEGESSLDAARREYLEEIGSPAPDRLLDLGEARMRTGKLIHAFAAEGDLDTSTVHSNLFSIEWPRHSGKMEHFPEVDRAEWFAMVEARRRILLGQTVFLERLEGVLDSGGS